MELLISVSLIAILSAGVVTLVGNSSRKYARDVRRQSDLQNIASAAGMYRNENTSYPPCPGATATCNTTALTILTTGGYMSSIPADPVGGRIYLYHPTSLAGGNCDGAATRCAKFIVCASSEKDTTTNNNVTCGGGCGAGNCVFMVTNP